MTTASVDGEQVLADLELSPELAVQMTAVGTLGMVLAWAVFGAVYQAGTHAPPTPG